MPYNILNQLNFIKFFINIDNLFNFFKDIFGLKKTYYKKISIIKNNN